MIFLPRGGKLIGGDSSKCGTVFMFSVYVVTKFQGGKGYSGVPPFV